MNPIQKTLLHRQEPEDMSTRELLIELVQEKRREETLRIIGWMIKAVVVIVLLIVLFNYSSHIASFFRGMSDTINSIYNTVQRIDQIVSRLGTMVDSLSGFFGSN